LPARAIRGHRFACRAQTQEGRGQIAFRLRRWRKRPPEVVTACASASQQSQGLAGDVGEPGRMKESDLPGSPAIRSPESIVEIDGIKVHSSVTDDRIIAAVEAASRSLENPGICIWCGADAEGVEPDARKYKCESCGELGVYGAEELLLTIT
jgi:hypothetical protein